LTQDVSGQDENQKILHALKMFILKAKQSLFNIVFSQRCHGMWTQPESGMFTFKT